MFLNQFTHEDICLCSLIQDDQPGDGCAEAPLLVLNEEKESNNMHITEHLPSLCREGLMCLSKAWFTIWLD